MNLEKYIEDTFSGLSYGKYLLLNSFYESIVSFKLPKKINIAVVGGGSNQAEIVIQISWALKQRSRYLELKMRTCFLI